MLNCLFLFVCYLCFSQLNIFGLSFLGVSSQSCFGSSLLHTLCRERHLLSADLGRDQVWHHRATSTVRERSLSCHRATTLPLLVAVVLLGRIPGKQLCQPLVSISRDVGRSAFMAFGLLRICPDSRRAAEAAFDLGSAWTLTQHEDDWQAGSRAG